MLKKSSDYLVVECLLKKWYTCVNIRMERRKAMSNSNDSLSDKLKNLGLAAVLSASTVAPAFSQNYEDFSKEEKERFRIETQEMRNEFEAFREDVFKEFNEFRNSVGSKSNEERVDEDRQEQKSTVVASQKEKAQVVKKDKNLEWHTTKDGRIDYAFGEENSITMNIRMLNVQPLMPKVYQKDNKYYCGSSVSSNYNVVQNMASMKVRNLVANKMIFDDMNERLKNGEQLNQYEAAFYSSFERNGMARLAREGIELNKEGKLVQNNPKGLLPYENTRSGR